MARRAIATAPGVVDGYGRQQMAGGIDGMYRGASAQRQDGCQDWPGLIA